jgi:two-component system capsular synthesis sensor histidine kinase RcsC
MRIPLRHALSAAFRAGAEGSPDPRRAKRIILSNQISLSIAFLSLAFVLVYLRSGASLMGWLEIPICLGYASVHLANRAGRTWFARVFLITLANLDVLVYTLSMGTATGQHLFFLLAGWAPLVLFDWEERRTMACGIALSSVLLLATEAWAPSQGWLSPVPAAEVPRLRLIQMLTMQAVEILLIFYFFRGNRATEQALALASETARAADEAKSRFLARMSVAIRAPLEEILGLSHLLAKSGLGPVPDRRATLEDIQGAVGDLLAFVDELLDLSRIEAGKIRLGSAVFSPQRLGHQVLRPFEIEAARKGLDLAFEADASLPSHLRGDAARLKQVLRNLVGNACKFTDAGGVVLRMRYGPVGPAGAPALACEVEDSGVGIPEGARARLFEPFIQGDASTARRYGGTGLGLFISRQIVERMGGAIDFAPVPGGGTVFRFHVPLPIAEPAAEGTAGSAADPARPSDGPISVPARPAEERSSVPERAAEGPTPVPARPPDGPASAPERPQEGPPVPGPGEGIQAGPGGRGQGGRIPRSGPAASPRMAPSDPAEDGWGGPSAPDPGAGWALPPAARSLRVLVVDDHPMNLKLLVRFLASYGITADTAASAREALEACAAGPYGLIFLDCHMPGMDGYACARRLREEPPPGGRPVIIGVTAEAPESALPRCREAGMDDLLPKPILEGRLRGLLAVWIGRLIGGSQAG